MLRNLSFSLALLAACGSSLDGAWAHAQTEPLPPARANPSVAAVPGAAASAAPAVATAALAVTQLPALTQTATRTERPIDQVPATVTVTPAATIQASGARDLKDLFRNEVDLSVRAAPGRFGAALAVTGRAGNEGLNIRGLEGNQVLMLVDGIRVPSSFSFGAFATGRADYLALEATQAVDVLRGPASTAFGSDGLAGAISLRTLDPADILATGQAFGGFVRLSGTQVDDSDALSAAAAWRKGPWQALLLGSQRQGHATGNQGNNEAFDSSRTAPNPLDYRQDVWLGKLLFSPVAGHQLGLTLESLQRRIDVEVLSGRTLPPPALTAAPAPLPATAVIDLDASDRIQRQRLSLEHLYEDLNGHWVQKSQTRLYLQDASTRQFSAEDRNTAADRTRKGLYRERVVGLSSQFERNLASAWPQRLSYGVDLSRTHIEALRDGTPSPSARPPFGEAFPVKPFPDTAYELAGAFVQSELQAAGLATGLLLIPGLRFDHFALQPSASGYTGGDVAKLSGQALTPRLGAVWRISESVAPYAQWATGFRAPTPSQVNNGFTNVASGYRSVGNSDLGPETAQSLEIGLRGRWAGLRWQVAAYDNRYRDFISQETISGAGTPADPTIFQFVNLAQARIRGAELRGEWRINAVWRLSAATAMTRGTRVRDGLSEPLDSIEPARTALGLRFEQGAWQLSADVLHARAKAADRVRAATPAAFTPPGYTVLDLGAVWRAAPGWTLIANLNNATDASYWRWSDVRGLADSSSVKDAYTAPGRHLQLALRHDF